MFRRTTSINKILSLKNKYRIIQGGTSAGKTYSIISILINEAIINKSITIDVVSMTYDHLNTGAITDFKKIMMETNRWNKNYWNETKHTYTFSNKSIIRFRALDTEGKARGPRRDILYINEANYIHYEIFEQLSIRTNRYVFIDFNPTQKFWAHDLVNRPDSDFIKLTYRDNECLDENILNEFKLRRERSLTNKSLENWCRVYLDGEIGRVEGTIFNNWEIINKIPEDARLLGYGMDFGYNPDPTTLIAIYEMDNNIYLDELIYQTELLPTDLDKLLQIKNISKELPIVGDCADPKMIETIRRLGYNIEKSDKGGDGKKFGIQLMNDRKIYLNSSSSNLINEFTKYSWKKNINGYTSEPIGEFNHAIDAVRYFFLNKLRNKGNFFNVYSNKREIRNGRI